MASNPTDVSHTRELVIGMDIEDIFHSQSSTQKVTPSGMDNALGLASRTRSL